jgi:hypothetical protein
MFSIMIGCPRLSLIRSAMIRPVTSSLLARSEGYDHGDRARRIGLRARVARNGRKSGSAGFLYVRCNPIVHVPVWRRHRGGHHMDTTERDFLAASLTSASESEALERRTIAKVAWRLLPFLLIGFFLAYVDRVNVGFANATMSHDLGLSAAAFGGAAGIFFVGYFFFEVPSNLALNRFGARVWLARIMFTWGIISGAQAFVAGEVGLKIVRFLLGAAEAGFYPGVIFFLTLWFPSAYRARIVGWFLVSVGASFVVGAPMSGLILDMEGIGGLHGWQWMFLIEGLPSLLMAFALFYYLTDRPSLAPWLTSDERKWLENRLDAERTNREMFFRMTWFRSMIAPRVLSLGIQALDPVLDPQRRAGTAIESVLHATDFRPRLARRMFAPAYQSDRKRMLDSDR